MKKLEYDWCKDALGKKYNVCYETEKGLERWIKARLMDYYWGNVILYDDNKNEIYHIPYSGLKWILPVKEKEVMVTKNG